MYLGRWGTWKFIHSSKNRNVFYSEANQLRLSSLRFVSLANDYRHLILYNDSVHWYLCHILKCSTWNYCSSFAFLGSFDGHLSLWNIGEQEPKLQHTIKCCEKAISTIFVLTDTLPGFLAIGSEDGLVHYVNMFISIENSPRLKSVSTQPQVKLWLWCSHQ